MYLLSILQDIVFCFLNKSKGDFKDFLTKLGFTYKSMNTSIFHLTIFCKMSLIVFYFMKYSEELKYLTLLASVYFTLCSDELFCFWQTAHFQYWGRGLLASSRTIRSST